MTKVHEEVIQQTQHAIMSLWDIYLVTSTELVCFSFGVAHLKRRKQSFQIVVHEVKLHLSYKGCRKLTLKDQQMTKFSLSWRRLWIMVSASQRWLLKISFGRSGAENLNLLHYVNMIWLCEHDLIMDLQAAKLVAQKVSTKKKRVYEIALKLPGKSLP